jgi:signal transduction histidine kinase
LALAAFVAGIIDATSLVGVIVACSVLIALGKMTVWILSRTGNLVVVESVSLGETVAEVLAYTIIIYFCGGIEATFLVLIYAALVMFVGIQSPPRFAFVAALTSSTSFALMVLLDYLDVVPHHPFFQGAVVPGSVQVGIVLVVSAMLLLLAVMAAHTGTNLRRAQAGLRRRTTELTETATCLKELTTDLERQNELLQVAFERATESDRLKTEFLANVSHELRTPLQGVCGGADLLLSGEAGELSDEQSSLATDLQRSGERLRALIDELLDFSSLSSGRFELHKAPVQVAELIEGCVKSLEPTAIAQMVGLACRCDEPTARVLLDGPRVGEIVRHLIKNAIALTPGDGKVEVGLQEAEAKNGTELLEISVTDTGIGLADRDLERIFEPFVQVDGSATRRHQGPGLGLSVARRLAELHGGTLSASSLGKGKGSTFVLRLPM